MINLSKHETIINATPHTVTVVKDNQEAISFLSSGILIRLKSETQQVGSIDGIPTSKTVFSDVTGLPEYRKGTYYIVSQLVKNALPERSDLLVPAEVLRDAAGNIIGCKSFGI